jgi:hypothetical protein
MMMSGYQNKLARVPNLAARLEEATWSRSGFPSHKEINLAQR